MKRVEVFGDKNKKQLEFIQAVFSNKYSHMLFGGAIRGGKSYVLVCIFIILCIKYPGSRWAIFRKDLKRLKRNMRPVINKFITGSDNWKVNESDQTFTHKNGSVIMFIGENFDKDKELEALRGLEINGAGGDEVSEMTEKWMNVITSRLGSYMIPNIPLDQQPKPIMICTCNPTQGWVKDVFYDPWKKDRLPKHMYYLPSYVTDNPYLSQAFINSLQNLPQYEYEVFVLGNWDVVLKTENAFWYSLDINRHVKFRDYCPETTIHVSIDANTMPYCTATLWQVFPDTKEAVQFAEILGRPRKNTQTEDSDLIESNSASRDNNHASGLGRMVSEYLRSVDYSNIVYVYGDSTTKNQNAIDEKKRSFYQIFIEELQNEYKTVDYVSKKNPQIAKTGQFVNALYEGYGGWNITINEQCRESLSDYFSVKQEMDGTMQKKKVTDENGNSYEEHGHCSDTKRYFLYRCLNDVYHQWDNRYSEPQSPVSVNIFNNSNIDGF